MEDRFVNRLTMFTRCLDLLDEADNLAVWQNQPPVMFTTKTGEARTMVGVLQDAQQDQETGVTGATTEKDREETELEDAAYTLAQACVMYYNDHQQETEAGTLDLTPTEWRKLRDQSLLAKAQLLIEQATALSTGATAAAAAPYGITPAAVTALTQERADYDAIINAPEVSIAVRKALTHGFKAAFNLVERKFVDLDRLILQFRATAPGRALVGEWQAARNIKGPGQGPGGDGGTVPAKAVIESVDDHSGSGTVDFTYSAVGATSFDIYLKGPVASEFTLHESGRTETTLTLENWIGTPWEVKVVGRNAAGAGEESDPASFNGGA